MTSTYLNTDRFLKKDEVNLHSNAYRASDKIHAFRPLQIFYLNFCLGDFAGDLFVVVFSMDCRESFEEAIRLREAIIETKMSAAQGATKSRSKSHYSLKVPMVIVGNKCDKDTKYVITV